METDIKEIDETSEMIKICRKIEALNAKQCKNWVQGLFMIFKEQDFDLLLNLIITGICVHRKSFSSEIYKSLLASLPSEKELSINDSISKNDPKIKKEMENENENENENQISIFSTSKDIKVHMLTFLPECDVFQVAQTCRCLCLAAHDPNALYHLDYYVNDWNAHVMRRYIHYRFSGLKSLFLYLSIESDSFPYKIETTINPKWKQSIKTLQIEKFDFDKNIKKWQGPELKSLENLIWNDENYEANNINMANLQTLSIKFHRYKFISKFVYF